MSCERVIKRHSAYFRGWCQAFGEHEGDFQERDEINWLYGEGRVGIVLADELRRSAYRELLGKRDMSPTLCLAAGSYVQIGKLRRALGQEKDRAGVEALIDLLMGQRSAHLYLSYHLTYPAGTRIVTFSTEKPLGILYKEIVPLVVTIL